MYPDHLVDRMAGGERDMRLPDAARAEQDRVLAASGIRHRHLVDALELFDDAEAGLPEAALAIDHLDFHHPGQELHLIFGRAPARRFPVFAQEGGQLQVMFEQDAGALAMASRVARSAAWVVAAKGRGRCG